MTFVIVIFFGFLFMKYPLKTVETLVNSFDFFNIFSEGDAKIEEIMNKRRQHLEQVCQSRGWSPDDPVPKNEDMEMGQLYHLSQFNSFVCL